MKVFDRNKQTRLKICGVNTADEMFSKHIEMISEVHASPANITN